MNVSLCRFASNKMNLLIIGQIGYVKLCAIHENEIVLRWHAWDRERDLSSQLISYNTENLRNYFNYTLNLITKDSIL